MISSNNSSNKSGNYMNSVPIVAFVKQIIEKIKLHKK